jgi:hypothetical protein
MKLGKRNVITRILAITGTILVWTPIIFTIVTAIIGTISDHRLRFDYLMPAELFPLALVGSLLLLWSALRALSKQKLIGWGLSAAIFFLISGQGIAITSGLASGEVEPTGWPWALALTCIGLYSLTLIEIGIAGLLLIRELFLKY